MQSRVPSTQNKTNEAEDTSRRDFMLTAASIGVASALPLWPVSAEAKGRNHRLQKVLEIGRAHV